MTPKTEHTPTPWRTCEKQWALIPDQPKYAETQIRGADNRIVIDMRIDHYHWIIDRAPALRDIQFMLLCVNSHAKLVKALEHFMRETEFKEKVAGRKGHLADAYEEARSALATLQAEEPK